jgi:hypothetical protein
LFYPTNLHHNKEVSEFPLVLKLDNDGNKELDTLLARCIVEEEDCPSEKQTYMEEVTS